MKKAIIAATFLLAALPFQAFALTPGAGGDLTCIPWNESIPLKADGTPPASYQGRTLCEGYGPSTVTTKRLYDLETAVQSLQQQNNALQAKIDQVKSAPATVAAPAQIVNVPTPDPATLTRVTNLENRMTALEKVVAYLQDTVTATLNKTIGLIQQLLKK